MTGKRDILQLQSLDHCTDVIGEPVVIISSPRPVGIAKPSRVHPQAAIPHTRQPVKLVFEKVMVGRPTMKQQDCFIAAGV